MSRCHTCQQDMPLGQARLHMWDDRSEHDVEFSMDEVLAELEQREREKNARLAGCSA